MDILSNARATCSSWFLGSLGKFPCGTGAEQRVCLLLLLFRGMEALWYHIAKPSAGTGDLAWSTLNTLYVWFKKALAVNALWKYGLVLMHLLGLTEIKPLFKSTPGALYTNSSRKAQLSEVWHLEEHNGSGLTCSLAPSIHEEHEN